MATLPELLNATVEMLGSDLHLTTNAPPVVRVHGKLVPLKLPVLTASETKQLAYSVCTDAQKKRFEESQELDFSFGIRGVGRFRCNVFNQRGAVAAVFRLIPERIPTLQELNLPPILAKLADKPRGLILSRGRPAAASRRRWRLSSIASTASVTNTSSPSRTRSSTSTTTRAAW